MTETTFPSATAGLPDTLEGCRVRLSSLHSEIAAIRLQISTADLRRQANRQTLDADWFHRAKTALRLKQAEAARLTAHLSTLAQHCGSHRRERFKDALIAAMRARPGTWVDVRTLAAPALNCTVQLMGSMVAWAK